MQLRVERIDYDLEALMVFLKTLSTALIAFSVVLPISSAQAEISGKVSIDGSSTVYPISEAIAEEFGKVQKNVRVTVGVSGTGGGFKKFLAKEIDIIDASRSIKAKEIKKAKDAGIEYIELPIAYDGIAVVVNKRADWVTSMTKEQLHMLWKPESKIKAWNQIDPKWPNKPIKLYGPGTDSGTFDYFTEAINGKSQRSRADFTKSEDDNVLVKGISGDKYGLGYFGFAYFQENKDRIKALTIDGGKGPVPATTETIKSGEYTPLSRPLFIYVSKNAAVKPQVQEFVRFYIKTAGSLVKDVGYIPLKDSEYKETLTKFNEFVTAALSKS